MRRALPALAALAIGVGCGGGEEAEPTGATGASGFEGAAEPAPVITVGEFIAELQPQKQRILREYVAQSEACAGTRVEASFVLLVTAAALDVPKGEPLGPVIEEQCGG